MKGVDDENTEKQTAANPKIIGEKFRQNKNPPN